MLVPGREEFFNGGDQIGDVEKGTAADAFVGEFSKPAFNQVQPTATGGDIVDYVARMLREPSFNVRVPVRAVIVHHQMQRRFARELAIDAAQETQELLMTVALMTVANYLARRTSSAANSVVVPFRL